MSTGNKGSIGWEVTKPNIMMNWAHMAHTVSDADIEVLFFLEENGNKP
jgi:hypothetical protein